MNLFFNEKEYRLRAGWRLLIQFVLFFFISGFAALALHSLWTTSLSITGAIPQLIGTVASIWFAARLLDKRPVSAYGLTFDRRWIKDFAAGVFWGSLAIAVIFAIEWQLGWVTIAGWGWTSSTDYSFPVALLSSFSAMLLVGFYEELLSRGYQILNLTEGLRYPQLGTRGAAAIATLTTSMLFGFMHAFNPNVSSVAIFNIIIAGIVLAVPYLLTGSLGLSVGLHFSWNFVQGSVFGYPVSGTMLDASIIRPAQQGPDFWTGGTFGPEAGAVGLLGMAIMLGGTLVYTYRSRRRLALAELFHIKNELIKSNEQAR